MTPPSPFNREGPWKGRLQKWRRRGCGERRAFGGDEARGSPAPRRRSDPSQSARSATGRSGRRQCATQCAARGRGDGSDVPPRGCSRTPLLGPAAARGETGAARATQADPPPVLDPTATRAKPPIPNSTWDAPGSGGRRQSTSGLESEGTKYFLQILYFVRK